MSIIAKNVCKSIGTPSVQILKDLSFEIPDQSFLALTGKSGSGKSTLLYLLSSLDNATSGSIEVDGINLQNLSPQELYRFRNQKMGFIFQSHYLIAELSALENVILPAKKFEKNKNHTERAHFLLEECGLGKLTNRLPRQLSGGEQQRVAIARALMMNPRYLFADEPTGSLDTSNGDIVMNLIKKANKDTGTTVILVTHDPDFAAQARSQINLIDGRIDKGSRKTMSPS
ncbi:MAG: ATP-binding protein [Bdellovibrionales bacterium RIFCSPHIGHO2_01_FULL_40_29]|nr:MAG: ATP-binding protein [Bdellovibrionales bacterium RIFCSPHIGHO2_01_FULL_40_29]OFZ33838.1 MAG: ATP-binding protein [Bdellovibrionales bacterium RIFCSPHIGHO2_02_FULL_40_15]